MILLVDLDGLHCGQKNLVDLCLYELDDEQCVAYGTELSLQE
jgi:hypothetical protein